MLWDLFCNVIDNYGDIGVCWRLSADLAARGDQVRLWVDDPGALDWMAPGAREGRVAGVQVLPWSRPFGAAMPPERLAVLPRADVWIEAFGCEIAPEFIAHFVRSMGTLTEFDFGIPVWINLEYLSAESYVERSHGLPSPVMSGPGRGLTKFFYYPGFTPRTGGLLRESDLASRQAAFAAAGVRAEWLARQGAAPVASTRISLFCYEPGPLAAWLAALDHGPQPVQLLVAPGRPSAAVRAAIGPKKAEMSWPAGPGMLSISYLSNMPQREFDLLLWACDLNFVRGEDSLVRALWAGQPLVWQIYPQDDAAHHAKLEAFLDWLQAPASMRRFHRVWNGVDPGPLPAPELPAWRDCVRAARARLLAQDDLTSQLRRFVLEKR